VLSVGSHEELMQEAAYRSLYAGQLATLAQEATCASAIAHR
jgi:hypothetical protein